MRLSVCWVVSSVVCLLALASSAAPAALSSDRAGSGQGHNPDRLGNRGAAAVGAEPCGLNDWRARLDAVAASLRVEREEVVAQEDRRGRPLDSIDLGVSGAIDGCLLLDGLFDSLTSERYGWLLDTDIALQQESYLYHVVTRPTDPLDLPPRPTPLLGSPMRATSTFSAAAGAGLRLVLPGNRRRWNGRLVALTTGSGIYRDMAGCYITCPEMPVGGTLVPRSADGSFTEGLGANVYAELLLDRGYAVAWIRKDEIRPPGGVNRATLASDGSTVRVSHHSNVAYTLGLIEFAQREVARRLGRAAKRTYLYGHSSGGMTVRLVNYRPEANTGSDGGRIVDGILADDSGGSMYLPVGYDAKGRDTVLDERAERAAFVPQIDVTRALYSMQLIPARRANASLLDGKGLGNRHRHFEVAGVAHFDAGMAGTTGTPEALDLGGLWEALYENLDSWSTREAAPPASRQGDEAVRLPEVECPLGVRYAPGDGPMSAFAAFDGMSLEPLDPRTGALVDVNGDGARGTRETVTQAWRRLGLLRANTSFSVRRLRHCLARSARRLRRQRLLSGPAAAWYAVEAQALLDRSGARG